MLTANQASTLCYVPFLGWIMSVVVRTPEDARVAFVAFDDIGEVFVATPTSGGVAPLDLDLVRASIEAAVEHLRSEGALVKEVSLPSTDLSIASYYVLATAEASSNLTRFDVIRKGRRVPINVALTAAPKAGKDDVRNLTGVHPFDGARVSNIVGATADELNLEDDEGVVILSVRPNSIAANIGFKTGDIIRKIDGTAMTDSTDVTARIGNAAPGTTIKVEVWRDGKPVELAATVGTLDDGKIAKAGDDAATKGKLGVAVRPLTPEEKKSSGISGLVVEKSGGAAARAGVQPGDVILGVGPNKVDTVDELKSQVEKAGKSVALLIERDGRKIYVPVRIS